MTGYDEELLSYNFHNFGFRLPQAIKLEITPHSQKIGLL